MGRRAFRWQMRLFLVQSSIPPSRSVAEVTRASVSSANAQQWRADVPDVPVPVPVPQELRGPGPPQPLTPSQLISSSAEPPRPCGDAGMHVVPAGPSRVRLRCWSRPISPCLSPDLVTGAPYHFDQQDFLSYVFSSFFLQVSPCLPVLPITFPRLRLGPCNNLAISPLSRQHHQLAAY